jgi:hypothetical protein
MAQGAGRHDRHLLRDWDTETAEQESEKDPPVPEVPDPRLEDNPG